MMGDVEDPSAIFVESSRFWVQRVVVPILVCVGVVGNVISVIILTRRRMRSSTNAYLTALAVADTIYLFFVLLLSFKHYPNISDRKYELYWRFYGLSHWLCDAASSTSVWLTVSFTLERYIVVWHPIKGKVLCTENRAKIIIAVISILCFLATASTTFEHQLTFKEQCVRICDSQELESLQLKPSNNSSSIAPRNADYEKVIVTNCSHDGDLVHRSVTEEVEPNNGSLVVISRLSGTVLNTVLSSFFLNTTCCEKKYTIGTEETSLGKNKTYKNIFYWFSSIVFGLLPLVLIATFNCFLVNAVYKSNKQRKKLTNTQEKMWHAQENRITLLLVGIVILFLICQFPTACYLIYDSLVDDMDPYSLNIMYGLGNIFNALLTLNAACNFMLYCVLSDKYRRTFRAVFCKRNLSRQDTVLLTTNTTLAPSKNGIRRGRSDYVRTPRNLEDLDGGGSERQQEAMVPSKPNLAQSFNSIPRSKSLIQRPLGKAKSTDLHV